MEHSECEFHSMECSLKITRDITDVLKPFQEMSELLKDGDGIQSLKSCVL